MAEQKRNFIEVVGTLSEVDLKDRFVKIRIRYKGDELAIINYIKTLYEQSFS